MASVMVIKSYEEGFPVNAGDCSLWVVSVGMWLCGCHWLGKGKEDGYHLLALGDGWDGEEEGKEERGRQ